MQDKKTARVTWTGDDLTFTATAGSGYRFAMSSAPGETAGSPMELLLAGVAGCTAVDVVSILQKMRQPVTGVTVEINGLRAGQHPKVYTDVELVYVVQGEGVDETAVQRAINLSKESYCSASIMFARAGANITTSYRIEQPAHVNGRAR